MNCRDAPMNVRNKIRLVQNSVVSKVSYLVANPLAHSYVMWLTVVGACG